MRILLLFLLCLASMVCFADQDEISTAKFVGDFGQFALPLTALGVSLADSHKDMAMRAGLSVGTTLGIAYSLKYTWNEKRPNGGPNSFPSGHTSAAFAGASFIQLNYGWKWGIPAYAAASYVGWSRVASKAHWYHDVLVGAGLGIGVNMYFANAAKGKSPRILNIFPSISEEQTPAISAVYAW